MLPAITSPPPLLSVDGVPHTLITMGIDNSRRQIRIETGGAFTGSMSDQPSPVPQIPASVPTDAFYVEVVPGASWGSWQQRPHSS